MNFKQTCLILGLLPMVSLAVAGFPNELVLHVNNTLEDEEKYALQSIQYFYDYSSKVVETPLEAIQSALVLPWNYDDKPVMMTQLNLWDEAKDQIVSTCLYWDEQYIYHYVQHLNVNISRITDGGYSWNSCKLTD